MRQLQDTLRASPDDVRSLGLLASPTSSARARPQTPPSSPRPDGVLRRALRLDPRDAAADERPRVACTHPARAFAGARARRSALASSRRSRPGTSASSATLSSSSAGTTRRSRPSTGWPLSSRASPRTRASRTRVSCIGRPRDAIAAMELALDAAGGRRSRPRGRTSSSASSTSAAASSACRVRTSAPRSRPSRATSTPSTRSRTSKPRAAGPSARSRSRRRAVESIPLPQFAATLGDLYRVAGRSGAAREQYALVAAIETVSCARAGSAPISRPPSSTSTTACGWPRRARARAAARSDRPSIEGDDVLAWALAANGRCGEALRFSKRALRLGTRDAPKLFHRGMIERCLGREAAARRWFRRALAVNPHFSPLWAPVARRYAA